MATTVTLDGVAVDDWVVADDHPQRGYVIAIVDKVKNDGTIFNCLF